MGTQNLTNSEWMKARIPVSERDKYLEAGKTFIDDQQIQDQLAVTSTPDSQQVRDIIAKSRAVEVLNPTELAMLMRVEDEDLWAEMRQAAGDIKRTVYDNRIVTFAPLYLSNDCVNNCAYCGLRRENKAIERRRLSMAEIRKEIEVLAGEIGHKRLIVVFGEHPSSGIDYIISSLHEIYDVEMRTRKGVGQIRRANVNAAPMSIDELRRLHGAGIGTFQVFQETYHPETYRRVHPQGTLKGDYAWRLYCMHRAFEAGIDDVGIGALFGLYDWRYEMMGLLYHSLELEARFGVGPHTISFPRLEPAAKTPFIQQTGHEVSDADIAKIVVLLRLAVPYTGLILTARENAELRRQLIPLGCTQTDASSRIGIGAYSDAQGEQKDIRQQFMLGDDRSLDEVVRELAQMGYITSFCTAGYRCGRTGECIMSLLRNGQEGQFCKLNAVITFREWLDDFASPETAAVGEKVIKQEIEEVRQKNPAMYAEFLKAYEKTADGSRDLYF